MASDISPTTGERFYSGTWTDIQDALRILDLGEGKMSKVNQPMVNRNQEVIDREIDAIVGECYQTPLRAMNQVQPNGATKRVFPGDLQHAAEHWVAAHILLHEFQQLEQNTTDQANLWLGEAKAKIYAMIQPSHRIPGQRRKSNISRTMPPNFQPPHFPEPPA